MKLRNPLPLAALALLLSAVRPPVASAQAELDRQLLANPGAEEGASSPDGGTAVALPGWDTGGTKFTVVPYAPNGIIVNDAEGARIGGGKNFFFGGLKNNFSWARQMVDVSALAAEIDKGGVYGVISAFLTAYKQEGDNGTIEMKFHNASNVIIGPTVTLGPQPGNFAQWTYYRNQAAVPAGTRAIQVQMVSKRLIGNDNDSDFDNLSLFLTRSLPYAPANVPVPSRQSRSANLVQNGDAEAGTASPSGGEVVPIPGWQTTGNFTVGKYGGANLPPAVQQPDLLQKGANGFAGGPGAGPSSATQDVDLTPYAADIDAGKLNLRLSVYMAADGTGAATARATVDELDAAGNTVLTLDANGVTGSSRGFIPRLREAPLWKGARKARITLAAAGDSSNAPYTGAYFDNVDLSLIDAYTLPDPIAPNVSYAPVAYGANLLQNPDAERANPAFDTYANNVPIPGWAVTNNFTAIDFYQPEFLIGQEAERIGGGRAFFAGGFSPFSTAAQTVDVSRNSVDIDAGGVTAHLEAQMGGWGTQGDVGRVVATFLDYSTAPLGSMLVGVSSSRNPLGGSFDFYQKDAEVPPGTRQIQVMMVAERLAPSYNDAYFDNLWLSLNPKPAPPLLMGDVNGDDKVAVDDAVMLLRATLRLQTLDAAAQQRADMNGDGAATIADAPPILRRVVGLNWTG